MANKTEFDLTPEEIEEIRESRKHFPFYRSYQDAFKVLTNEEAGKLLIAVLDYQFFGKVPNFGEDERVVSVMFESLKINLDAAFRSYVNQSIRNRENGKKGGRPSKTQSNPLGSCGLNKNPQKAKEPNRGRKNPKKGEVEVDVGVGVNNILKAPAGADAGQSPPDLKPSKPKTKEKVEEIKTDIITDYFGNDKVNLAFNEFLKARKELKIKNTPRAVKLLVDKLQPYPADAQYNAITESIMNGWKGVFPKNSDKQDSGTGNPFLDMLIENGGNLDD